MLFRGTFYYNLGDNEIVSVEGDLLPTIGPLSEFTVIKTSDGRLLALRNKTIVKIDILGELNEVFVVDTDKIIEQVEFTKLMADTEFENDKKNFGKKDKNMPNFHSHFHH